MIAASQVHILDVLLPSINAGLNLVTLAVITVALRSARDVVEDERERRRERERGG